MASPLNACVGWNGTFLPACDRCGVGRHPDAVGRADRRWSRPVPRPPADPLHASRGLSPQIQPHPLPRVMRSNSPPAHSSSEEHDRLRARTEADNAAAAGGRLDLQDLVADLRRQLERRNSPSIGSPIAFGPSSERFAGPTHTGSASSRRVRRRESRQIRTPMTWYQRRKRLACPASRLTRATATNLEVVRRAGGDRPGRHRSPARVLWRGAGRAGEPSRRYDYRPAALFADHCGSVTRCPTVRAGGTLPPVARPPLPASHCTPVVRAAGLPDW